MKHQANQLYGVGTWIAVLAVLLVQTRAQSQTPTIVRVGSLGGSYATAYAVNAQGVVAGDSMTLGNAEDHAYVFSEAMTMDLGTLGGSYSAAFAINASGQVAGYSAVANDAATYAFLFRDGRMESLGSLGGWFCSAVAINDAGWVAGDSVIANNYDTHAFLYDGHSMIDLGTLGGAYSSCYGLNGRGWVVGESTTTDNQETHAFLWRDGSMTDLGTLGGTYSSAVDINDDGWITGFANTAENRETHGFLYDGSNLHDLGTLGGGYTSPVAINRKGQVSGDSLTASRGWHGFIYADGALTDLETLGGSYSSVYDMNQSGQVVGESADATGAGHAFLWENGTMVDLNTLLPPGSGWELLAAYNISDGGHILGYGVINRSAEWFLLSLNRAPANNPPVADAGPDQQVECAGAGTTVRLDGAASQDPDGDALTYEWYCDGHLLGTEVAIPVVVGNGINTFTLKVTDPAGESSEDTVTVTVVDTTPPQIVCPTTSELPANDACQATIPDLISLATATDGCTPAESLVFSQSPVAGTLVGLGRLSGRTGRHGCCRQSQRMHDDALSERCHCSGHRQRNRRSAHFVACQ